MPDRKTTSERVAQWLEESLKDDLERINSVIQMHDDKTLSWTPEEIARWRADANQVKTLIQSAADLKQEIDRFWLEKRSHH